MKKLISALFLVAFAMTSSFAFADADDTKWIAQCIKDNKKEGAKEEVVYKYCECMNNKMSNDETKSITQWEKSHPKEMKECEKEAGWK
ncbi:MAG: hypothetical protein L7F77_08500 [Candidatus Magnetominusculus sp. LBB02]|nr:hypothetical protein [Candidatus Magnetominusculus sp. LBB02]